MSIVKHKVLYCREQKSEKQFRPIATREIDDPNAEEDFLALRVMKIIDAQRSGAERPEFGVGIQVKNLPENAPAGAVATAEFIKFGPNGPVKFSAPVPAA